MRSWALQSAAAALSPSASDVAVLSTRSVSRRARLSLMTLPGSSPRRSMPAATRRRWQRRALNNGSAAAKIRASWRPAEGFCALRSQLSAEPKVSSQQYASATPGRQSDRSESAEIRLPRRPPSDAGGVGSQAVRAPSAPGFFPPDQPAAPSAPRARAASRAREHNSSWAPADKTEHGPVGGQAEPPTRDRWVVWNTDAAMSS